MNTLLKSNRQRGAAAVEMAIILLPMLILCFGVLEIGRALYTYNGLVKSTRGAVRYLTAQSLESPPAGETAASIRLKARSMAVCGAFDCSGDVPPLVSGLTLAHVQVCDPVACPGTHNNVPTGQGTADLVSVTIGGPGGTPFTFSTLVPLGIGDLTFTPVTTTMVSQFF
jgi:Flp pilus assembly protein TadG